MFDINDLKRLNDCYGHASGDRIIRAAATVIAENFGRENTFRIGGDEFIAVVEGTEAESVERRLAGMDAAIAVYNKENADGNGTLSLSRGQARFTPGQDGSFRDVFVRADKRMYECKRRYHHSDLSRTREEFCQQN